MKKLLPALCLLLVSAMLLGTSTYAWFSMNTTVTATGMQVQASVPTSLVIKKTTAADTAWSNTVTLTTPANNKLSPCTPKAKAANTADALSAFYKLTTTGQATLNDANSAGSADITTNANPATDTTNFESAGAITESGIVGYVIKDSFDLKMASSADSASTNIKLSSITITNGDENWVNVYKALRIVFEVTYEGTTTYKVVDVGATTPVGNTITISDTSTFVTLTEYEKVCTVKMYVWYEGTDEDCFTNNALTADELTINLTFTK